jgi:hypothetical protein
VTSTSSKSNVNVSLQIGSDLRRRARNRGLPPVRAIRRHWVDINESLERDRMEPQVTDSGFEAQGLPGGTPSDGPQRCTGVAGVAVLQPLESDDSEQGERIRSRTPGRRRVDDHALITVR